MEILITVKDNISEIPTGYKDYSEHFEELSCYTSTSVFRMRTSFSTPNYLTDNFSENFNAYKNQNKFE